MQLFRLNQRWGPGVGRGGRLEAQLKVKVAQSCPTLWDPMDCSPPGSSVHGISQARVLEWVAMPCSKGSSQPRDQTQVSCISCIHWQVDSLRAALSGKSSNTINTIKMSVLLSHHGWTLSSTACQSSFLVISSPTLAQGLFESVNVVKLPKVPLSKQSWFLYRRVSWG